MSISEVTQDGKEELEDPIIIVKLYIIYNLSRRLWVNLHRNNLQNPRCYLLRQPWSLTILPLSCAQVGCIIVYKAQDTQDYNGDSGKSVTNNVEDSNSRVGDVERRDGDDVPDDRDAWLWTVSI